MDIEFLTEPAWFEESILENRWGLSVDRQVSSHTHEAAAAWPL